MFEPETQQLESEDDGDFDASGRRSRIYLTSLVSATALLGGILFGYDLGIVASALLQLTDIMHLTCLMKELLVSGLLFGAVIGSCAGGVLLDFFGRRPILIVNSLFFVIGALILSVSQSFTVVFIGRLLVGISVSVTAMGECVYCSEVASRQHRGKMVSLNEMGITLGILLAYLVGYLFIQKDQGWRFMFGLSAIPAVLQFFCLLLLPSSPRFLLMQGRTVEAEVVLRRLRAGDVREEMEEICTLVQNENNRNFCDLCSRTGNYHYRLFLGVSIAIFQQLSGQSNMIYYAPILLRGLGIRSKRITTLITVGLGLVKVISTFIAISVVDRVGRRRLLTLGSCVMAIALMVIAAVAAELPSGTERGVYCVEKWSDVGFHPGLDLHNTSLIGGTGANDTIFVSFAPVSVISVVSALAFMIYVSGYAFSFGPVAWLLMSEIFPPTLRGRAVSVGTTMNWTVNLLVSLSFLTLLERIGAPATFGLYCAACVLVAIFVVIFLPETKGKSLEQISKDFDSGASLPRFLRSPEARDVNEDMTNVTYSHLQDSQPTVA